MTEIEMKDTEFWDWLVRKLYTEAVPMTHIDDVAEDIYIKAAGHFGVGVKQ